MARSGRENSILILSAIYFVLMLLPFIIFHGINGILVAPFIAACLLPFIFVTLSQLLGFNDLAFSTISDHDKASKKIEKRKNEII